LKKEKGCNGFNHAAADDHNDHDDHNEYIPTQAVCKYRLNVLLLCPQLYNAVL
jgi:hypothetical protein